MLVPTPISVEDLKFKFEFQIPENAGISVEDFLRKDIVT